MPRREALFLPPPPPPLFLSAFFVAPPLRFWGEGEEEEEEGGSIWKFFKISSFEWVGGCVIFLIENQREIRFAMLRILSFLHFTYKRKKKKEIVIGNI